MKYIIIIILSLPILSNIVSNAPTEDKPNKYLPLTENSDAVEPKALVEAQNAFGLNLFKKANELSKEDNNIIISPFSVAVALHMVANGAKGETLKQFEQMLHTSKFKRSNLNAGYFNYLKQLKRLDQNLSFEVANAIVYDSIGMYVNPAFAEKSKKYYNAEMAATNFNSSKAVSQINDWVKANTDHKIKKIIDKIEDDEIMFLLNAVYFKGSWSKSFNTNNTVTRSFYLENDSIQDVDMMGEESRWEIYTNQKLKALNLPLGDSIYNMLFILPEDKNLSLKEFTNNFSLNNFETITKALSLQSYDIKIPKFELSYKNDKMKQDLKALGLIVGDISGIGRSPFGPLDISRVIHKTFLKIDEEGATAAAVTAVAITAKSVRAKAKELYFDRPFLCIIWEKENNSLLFVSKITNPKG